MIGDKIYKPLNDAKLVQYAQLAEWCNSNNAVIHETEEYYIAMEIPAPSYRDQLIEEKEELKGYLNSTDWIVTKCMERGLNIQTEYPEEYRLRGEARTRIDEINEELGE